MTDHNNNNRYNAQEMAIFTASDRDVKVWDARSGVLLREFPEIVSAEITDMAFDSRQRKFIIGSQDGNTEVFNCLNGASMKVFTRHASEVSCLAYVNDDMCVVSGSWDRQVCVHDEESASGELLRRVSGAHTADINAMAFSYDLSLVATGSANATVKVPTNTSS